MLPTNRPFAGLLGLQGTPWAGALAGLGSGLLSAGSGGNFGQGFTGGIQNWQQQMAERQRMQQDQELFDLRRQQMEAEQQAAAITQQQKDAQAAAVKKWVTTDPRVAPYADALMANTDAAYEMLAKLSEPVKPEGPQSGIGKIMADLNAGLIDQSTADALIKKETYIAPSAGSMPTERERNARAAGLVPGTPEYQQYLLGRDDTAPGPFQGTGLDQQSYNIVLTGTKTGQVDTPEYAAAYMQLAQPRTTLMPDGTVQTVSPDMSWATKPSGMQTAKPSPSQQITQMPGATVTTVPGSGITPQDRLKLRGVKAEATAIKQALNDFKSAVKSASYTDRASAVTGGLTEGGRKLNSAWTNAAIMTKAEALFNLGVLNGPDLSVIQGTLPNPSTLTGAFTEDAAYEAAIDTVIKLIDDKVAAFEAQFGGTPYTRGGDNDPLGIR